MKRIKTLGARAQDWLHRPEASSLAVFASQLVSGFARARRTYPTFTPERPTIVVGGLSVGGAGKTPVAAYLATRLSQCNRTAYVARGWLGRASGPREIKSVSPRRDGDEVAMLFDMLPPEVRLWAAADLEAGRRRATEQSDVIIVDDGFQSARLKRTMSIVVLDATCGRRVLPAGPLREPFEHVKFADLVWVNKINEVDDFKWEWSMPTVESRYVIRRIRAPDGSERTVDWLHGRQVSIVSGIGRPDSFLHLVRHAGGDVQASIVCRDHRSSSARQLGQLNPAYPVLTTAKDAVRWRGDRRPYVVEIELAISSGHRWIDGLCAEFAVS